MSPRWPAPHYGSKHRSMGPEKNGETALPVGGRSTDTCAPHDTASATRISSPSTFTCGTCRNRPPRPRGATGATCGAAWGNGRKHRLILPGPSPTTGTGHAPHRSVPGSAGPPLTPQSQKKRRILSALFAWRIGRRIGPHATALPGAAARCGRRRPPVRMFAPHRASAT